MATTTLTAFELYAMIFAQTKRVNRIIEDVLSLSHQAKPQSVQFDMRIWIHQFAEHLPHLMCLCIPDDLDGLVVQFDTHQLEQILINFINNGLRYSSQSHPHAFVEIEIYARQKCYTGCFGTGAGVPSIEPAYSTPFYDRHKRNRAGAIFVAGV